MELVRVFGHTFGSIASVILSVDFEFIMSSFFAGVLKKFLR